MVTAGLTFLGAAASVPRALGAPVPRETATAAPLTWSAPRVIDQLQGRLTAISCPSSDFCMAGDYYGNVVRFNGVGWSRPKNIFSKEFQATRLSCTSATFCMAMTQYDEFVYYRIFDGTSWSPRTQVAAGGVESVSCVSAQFCLLDDHYGAIFTFDGTQWVRAGGLDVYEIGGGELVSCPTTTVCTVIHTWRHVAQLKDGEWSEPVDLEPAGYPFRSLSCPTVNFCAAGSASGRIWMYNGTSWRSSRLLDGYDELRGMSCTSASFCIATDTTGAVLRYDGSQWTKKIVDAGHRMGEVSCSSRSFCQAVVREYSSTLTYARGAWRHRTEIDHPQGSIVDLACTSTSSCAAVDAEGNATLFGVNQPVRHRVLTRSFRLTDVACSKVRCVAIGSPADGGRAIAFTSTSVGPMVPVDPHHVVTGVTCAGTMCWIVDDAGRLLRTSDGIHWSQPKAVDTTGLADISCPTPTFCLAVDWLGDYVRFTNSRWSRPIRPAIGPGRAFGYVHCTTTTLCTAGDVAGYAYRYVGQRWVSIGPDMETGYAPPFTACSSATACTTVTYGGQYWSFAGGTWTRYAFIDLPAFIGDLACPTAGACIVADSWGRALFAAPTT
jgi:hypothetical protein